MKKYMVFFIASIISIFAFAQVDIQVVNDKNSNSTTVIEKNDTTRIDIQANWNQGTIKYKFQSKSEKLDMNVYANDMNRLYTEIKYKDKSVVAFIDFNLGQMTTDDSAALNDLLMSLEPSFLANIQTLASELPQGTTNLDTLQSIANALVNHDGAHTDLNAPWKYIYFSLCLLTGEGVNCCHCMWIVEKTHSECVNLGDCKPSNTNQ